MLENKGMDKSDRNWPFMSLFLIGIVNLIIGFILGAIGYYWFSDKSGLSYRINEGPSVVTNEGKYYTYSLEIENSGDIALRDLSLVIPFCGEIDRYELSPPMYYLTFPPKSGQGVKILF